MKSLLNKGKSLWKNILRVAKNLNEFTLTSKPLFPVFNPVVAIENMMINKLGL